jgi:pimeloyl-ACP methyl ester carboxylesterase
MISWIFIDLPGHGKTKQNARFSDLIKFLDDLCSPFHLVGYSLGGRVAQKLSHHKNCLSLSLLSSHTLFDKNTYDERRRFEESLKQDLLNLSMKDFLDKFYSSSLFSSLRRRKKVFEKLKLMRENLAQQDLIFGLNELGIENLVSDLPPIPVLALYGMLDLKYQKLYTCLSETVSVVSIPHAGHAIHLENPKHCLATLEKFIGTIEHDLANCGKL